MILLASPNEKMIAHWQKGLFGFSPMFVSHSLDSAREQMVRTRPHVLLLDYDLLRLDGNHEVARLVKLNADTKIMVFIPVLSDEVEWELYKAGAKACCRDDIKPDQLKHAVKAIQGGELWIRRTLTHLMLDELVVVTEDKNRIEKAVNDLLTNLTKREYEIAMLIGQGESNKCIARQLDITERTVKAHLTEIFRKLDISDRLKLALIMKDTMTLSNHSSHH
ncbi:MAG: response regulator transcription factor [Nitrosomonas sp.]|nr:response regulator transcription factor [Nitrosomonas sp.]